MALSDTVGDGTPATASGPRLVLARRVLDVAQLLFCSESCKREFLADPPSYGHPA